MHTRVVILVSVALWGCEKSPKQEPAVAASSAKAAPTASARVSASAAAPTYDPPSEWDAFWLGEKDKKIPIGRVRVEKGMLSIVSKSKDDENAEKLEDVVKNMNRKGYLLDPAPPGPDAARYTLRAKIYNRTDKGFTKVLVRKVREHEAVVLESVESDAGSD